MAGCMQCGAQRANAERLVVDEQVIELTAIAGHIATGIEQRAEDLLYRRNLTADADLPAELFFQVGRRSGGRRGRGSRESTRPAHSARSPARSVVGGRGGGVAGFRVVIQYAVDDRAVEGGLVQYQIADGVGGRVEEAFDVKFDAHELSP